MQIQLSEYLIDLYTFHSMADLSKLLSNCETGHILLENTCEFAQTFHAITLQTSANNGKRFGIGVCASECGLSPVVYPQPNASYWFIGFGSTVVTFDPEQKQVVTQLDLDSLFYHFISWPDHDITLAVHEIGVVALDGTGQLLWQFARDVITHTTVQNGSLHLEFMDALPVTLNPSGERHTVLPKSTG